MDQELQQITERRAKARDEYDRLCPHYQACRVVRGTLTVQEQQERQSLIEHFADSQDELIKAERNYQRYWEEVYAIQLQERMMLAADEARRIAASPK